MAVAFVSLSLVSCGDDKGKVIPRARLAEIYADMLITDQWISSTPGLRRVADTTLVYEAVLNTYGYTSADYRMSVDKYMDDPERFSRILRTSVKILDRKVLHLNKRKAELEYIKEQEERFEELRFESDLDMEKVSPYLFSSPYEHYYDSLTVEQDSASRVYRLVNIERADTLFEGLRMVVKDTLQVKDTVSVSDKVLE